MASAARNATGSYNCRWSLRYSNAGTTERCADITRFLDGTRPIRFVWFQVGFIEARSKPQLNGSPEIRNSDGLFHTCYQEPIGSGASERHDNVAFARCQPLTQSADQFLALDGDWPFEHIIGGTGGDAQGGKN
jgi:hypothetical protein